ADGERAERPDPDAAPRHRPRAPFILSNAVHNDCLPFCTPPNLHRACPWRANDRPTRFVGIDTASRNVMATTASSDDLVVVDSAWVGQGAFAGLIGGAFFLAFQML